MADGLHGEPGAAAARRVAMEHKHARALVQVLRQAMAVLSVKVLVPSLSHVIATHALQVKEMFNVSYLKKRVPLSKALSCDRLPEEI